MYFCFQIEHISTLIKLSKVSAIVFTGFLRDIVCTVFIILYFIILGRCREEIITDDSGQKVSW